MSLPTPCSGVGSAMRFPVSMGQCYVRSNRAQQSVKHPKKRNCSTQPHGAVGRFCANKNHAAFGESHLYSRFAVRIIVPSESGSRQCHEVFGAHGAVGRSCAKNPLCIRGITSLFPSCYADQSAFRESSRGAFLRKAASRTYFLTARRAGCTGRGRRCPPRRRGGRRSACSVGPWRADR